MTFFWIFIRYFFHFINCMHSDHILNDLQIDSCHSKNVFFINIHVSIKFSIIKFILYQCFFFVVVYNRLSCLRKSLSTFVVSHVSIFMIFRSLNSFALMKKLSTNKTCDWFAERFLHNCIINNENEIIFYLRA
jgi:hypothetical protein